MLAVPLTLVRRCSGALTVWELSAGRLSIVDATTGTLSAVQFARGVKGRHVSHPCSWPTVTAAISKRLRIMVGTDVAARHREPERDTRGPSVPPAEQCIPGLPSLSLVSAGEAGQSAKKLATLQLASGESHSDHATAYAEAYVKGSSPRISLNRAAVASRSDGIRSSTGSGHRIADVRVVVRDAALGGVGVVVALLVHHVGHVAERRRSRARSRSGSTPMRMFSSVSSKPSHCPNVGEPARRSTITS